MFPSVSEGNTGGEITTSRPTTNPNARDVDVVLLRVFDHLNQAVRRDSKFGARKNMLTQPIAW
jgi:hypothetical protein